MPPRLDGDVQPSRVERTALEAARRAEESERARQAASHSARGSGRNIPKTS